MMCCWAVAGVNVHPAWAMPFALILAAIAVLPIVADHWWHRNRNKLIIAAIIALPVIVYLSFVPGGPDALSHAAIEYVQFLVLLGSLYVIAGGIALVGDLAARPRVNVAFLAGGAVLANLVGTTGASMLLIRPLLRTNHNRHKTAHVPVFFILIVSNCGGLLTPLGDPPLFLGFLNGVEFSWTLRLWPQWLIVNGYLLALFFAYDTWCWRHESKRDIAIEETFTHPLRLYGWQWNGLLLLGVIAAVIAKKTITVFPLCELMMLACAGLSLLVTRRSVREANHFSWGPILEVAILFAAIFAAMIPVLGLLSQFGKNAPLTAPWHFFWVTGLFSSGLDNAPTYLAMAQLAIVVSGVADLHALSMARPELLAAISCGAVFLGANSYIGNGPNFMVKAIADQSKYKMPGFFMYVFIAALILLPIYVVITFLFFRAV